MRWGYEQTSEDEEEKVEFRKIDLDAERAALEEFFSIYAAQQARVEDLAGHGAGVRRTPKDVTVYLGDDVRLNHILHESYHIKGHAMFSELSPHFQKLLQDPMLADCYNVLLDAWADTHASEWFGKDIFSAHCEEIRQDLMHMKYPKLSAALAAEAYDIDDVPLEGIAPHILEAIALLRDDIKASRISDDSLAPLKVTIRLAFVLDYLRARERAEDERRKASVEKASVEEEDGESEGDEGEGVVEIEDAVKSEESSRPDRFKEKGREEEDVREKGTEKGRLFSSELPITLRAGAAAASSKADIVFGRAETREKKLEAISAERHEHPTYEHPTADYVEDAHAHAYSFLEVAQEEVVLEQKIRSLVGEYAGGEGVRLTRTGLVTPDIWRLALGNTKVFANPPLKMQEVVVMVDLSGSVGCWCKEHNISPGYLMFQSAAAIANAFPNRTTVFGFCSSERTNYIVPLLPGMAPLCRREGAIPSGNPDCVALQFLEQGARELEATTAIIISDGVPCGPSPLGDLHLEIHTRGLAYSLHSRGVRFFSVLVGRLGEKIYPSDIVVRIREVNDLIKLRNIFEGLE